MALSDYITPKKEEYILSEENGKAEVRRLLDFYEIELDPDAEEEAVKNTASLFDELARYYRLGLLETRKTAISVSAWYSTPRRAARSPTGNSAAKTLT
jgi:hypothetical protein